MRETVEALGETARQLRVLVVEDDSHVASATAQVLQARYVVEVALAASQARTLLAQHPFDVVLSDYDLGTETAEALLDHVRQTYPHLRRVLCSGATVFTVDRLLASGLVHAAVAKPAGAAQLFAVLERQGAGE